MNKTSLKRILVAPFRVLFYVQQVNSVNSLQVLKSIVRDSFDETDI